MVLLAAVLTLSACTDRGPDPVRSAPHGPSRETMVGSADLIDGTEIASLAAVTAENGSHYAVDTTVAGVSEPWQIDASIDADVSRTYCRTAPRPASMFYDGGSGLMEFRLPGPLIFIRYRAGTVTQRNGLIFRRAIYETREAVEAVDPAGHRWSFVGRFNALCRGGEFEIGPLVFGGQVVVPQNPITGPRLVGGGGGVGGTGGGDECGTGVDEEQTTYESGVYSPPPPSGCGSSTTGFGGTQPLAEDEWYAWYEGIRFRCHRVEDNTGGNIISCTVDG
jgi:hypothetical protein